jgi:hypothetical protein
MAAVYAVDKAESAGSQVLRSDDQQFVQRFIGE